MLYDDSFFYPYIEKMINGWRVKPDTPKDIMEGMRHLNSVMMDTSRGTPGYYIDMPQGAFKRLETPLKVIGTLQDMVDVEIPKTSEQQWDESNVSKESVMVDEVIIENGYVIGISTLQIHDLLNTNHLFFDPAALTTVGPMEKKEP